MQYLHLGHLSKDQSFLVLQFLPHVRGYAPDYIQISMIYLHFFSFGELVQRSFFHVIILCKLNFSQSYKQIKTLNSFYIRFSYLWLLSCNQQDFISSRQLRFRQGLLQFVGIWLVLFYFSYLKFGLLLWNVDLIPYSFFPV